MPQVRVQVPHQLGRDAAVSRLQDYSRRLRNDYGNEVADLKETWNEEGVVQFSFRVLGFNVSGTTTVLADRAEVNVKVPFAAIPFRGLIEKEIALRLESALANNVA